jgi:hypothetical protein
MSGGAPPRRELPLRPHTSRAATTSAQRTRLQVICAGVGFAVGTAVGFATAPDRIGVPPLLGALGLLLGLGLAASTRIPELKRTPAIRRVRAPGGSGSARSAVDVSAPSEIVEIDEQWIVPPGWYPDPRGTQPTRYWDGAAWTEQVAESVQS